MATRKKSAKRKAAAKTAADRIRETWDRINSKETRARLESLRARVERERKKAVRQLEGRLKELQSRIGKERRNVARMVEDGVQSALAALNIPSRQEVADLTAKVEQLSKKIDKVRRK
jgi:polyhydroxyalkanoate synthesis regulator phasin